MFIHVIHGHKVFSAYRGKILSQRRSRLSHRNFPKNINNLRPSPHPNPKITCHNATVSSIFRQQSSRANGAKSHGPITGEGKLASAANSALSTGPVTPEGKARSSLNAIDHGLLAKSVILPEENDEAFLHHLQSLRNLYRPTDYEENFILEKMAVADWQRMRAWCLEMAVIARATRQQQMTSDDLTSEMHQQIPAMHTSIGMKNLADSSPYLELLRRYGTGYSREARRLRQELQEHREITRLERRREQKRKSKISEQSEPNIGNTLAGQPPINTADTPHQPEHD
jgi:hypothetical protein